MTQRKASFLDFAEQDMHLLYLVQTSQLLALGQDLLPQYRRATEAYFGAVLALGFRLLRMLALALRLPADHFAPFFDPPMAFLRPLHYVARASAPDEVETCLDDKGQFFVKYQDTQPHSEALLMPMLWPAHGLPKAAALFGKGIRNA